MLGAWSGPGWPDPETERRYRAAMSLPSVAHSALEYYRWFVPVPAPAGRLAVRAQMRAPIQAPTLHLHGALDTCVLPARPAARAGYVEAPYRWRLIDGAGHFPHEERPERSIRNCAPGWPTRAGTVTGPTQPGTRDRDAGGRARNARPRDALGRPLSRGAVGDPRLPDDRPCPRMLHSAWPRSCSTPAGPFHAHEVLEASWKAAPARRARPVARAGAGRGRADARPARQRPRCGSAAAPRRAAGSRIRRPRRRTGSTPRTWPTGLRHWPA